MTESTPDLCGKARPAQAAYGAFEELRDGTLNILFVGRFEERKGLIHLLKAYHRLRKRKVDARLLVVGAGMATGGQRSVISEQNKLIGEAKERVFDTNKSVSEIAYELGFKYPQHFTRLFKQRVGHSPSEFRNLN